MLKYINLEWEYNMKFILIIISTIVLFSGCAPIKNVPPQFKPKSSLPQDKGYVIFDGFGVPIDSGELITRFVFGIPRGFIAGIYDVTDGLEFIGKMSSNDFIEYNPPVGRRTFMLVTPPFIEKSIPIVLEHTDFIEVNVTKEKTTHISLSVSGIIQKPYFYEVNFNEQHFDYCLQLQGDYRSKDENLTKYMSTQGIDLDAKYFKHYCEMFSENSRKVVTPESLDYTKFEQHKTELQNLKEKYISEWKEKNLKSKPFDLSQITTLTVSADQLKE
jgi:hypothetical protein